MPFVFPIVALGLFIGLFPFFFSFQRTFFGQLLSVRALGDILGLILLIIGILTLFSKIWRDRMFPILTRFDALTEKQFRLVVGWFTCVFCIGVLSHKFQAHAMLRTHAFDLGFFSNICWNTSQGDWFYSSLLERNFMAVHVNWILWPLSFFYKLWPDARVLLIAQVIFMGAAFPIFALVARRLLRTHTEAFLASVLFVSSPYYLHSLFNDFHPDSWQLPCLMLALWAYHNSKPGVLFVASLLALLAKEDVSVVLVGFSVFLCLKKNWRILGAILGLASVGAFIFHTQWFTPQFIEGQKSLLFSRYSFGQSFSELILALFFKPHLIWQAMWFEPTKYGRFLMYFFPAMGLTFLAWPYIIPCVVSVIPHLLSSASTQLSLADIYAMPAQPFIFVGATVGYLRLKTLNLTWANPKNILGVTFIVMGLGIYFSPKSYRLLPDSRRQAFHDLLALIPPDASVAAQQDLLPHFDTRKSIQLFPLIQSMVHLQRRLLANPDYVVGDRIGNALPFNKSDLDNSIRSMDLNRAYKLIYDNNNFMVYHRITNEPPRWIYFSQ